MKSRPSRCSAKQWTRLVSASTAAVPALAFAASLMAVGACSGNPAGGDADEKSSAFTTSADLSEGSVERSPDLAPARVDRGECAPGRTQGNPCPRCGTRSRQCYADGSWSDWGGCVQQLDCELGDVLLLACGDGSRTERRCRSSCIWGAPEANCISPTPLRIRPIGANSNL